MSLFARAWTFMFLVWLIQGCTGSGSLYQPPDDDALTLPDGDLAEDGGLDDGGEPSLEDSGQQDIARPPSDIPLPPSDIPLPQSDIPMVQYDIPMPQSDVPWGQQADVALPQSDIPLPQSDIPLPQADVALPQSDIPAYQDRAPSLLVPPGGACDCDQDCQGDNQNPGLCISGICGTQATTDACFAGSRAECPSGQRCWSGTGLGICYPDYGAGECDGVQDQDGSCVHLEGQDCYSGCGILCGLPGLPPDDRQDGGLPQTDVRPPSDVRPQTDMDPGPINCYTEPVFPEADLSDLANGYSGRDWMNTMMEAIGRRYPAGHDLLVQMADDPYTGTFTDPSSFSSLMESLMTEVHEGTHGWDYGHGDWVNTFAYYLRADLTYVVPAIDGFPRSEILSMITDDSTSLYEFYLQGQQGTYGFVELLDEMNSYINGLGGVAFVADYIDSYGFSAIDGAVAFMYYLELYLRRARTVYPDLYAEIQSEPLFLDLITNQWLRLHFFLIHADEFSYLGVHDAEIRQNLYAPDNQAEIEMFIGAELDESNCLVE